MLARRLLAEFLGTGALLVAIVGSGIAASELTTNGGIRLGINATTTAAALIVILTVLGPISGAHLHPLVSITDALLKRRPWREALAYIPAQIAGGAAGTILANFMFGQPAVSISSNDRATIPHLLAETIASAGLLLSVVVLARSGRSRLAPFVVAPYIGAAYFATSSTSFANPAVTVARMFSDTFAGIAPGSVVPFVAAQTVGAAIGVALAMALTEHNGPVQLTQLPERR